MGNPSCRNCGTRLEKVFVDLGMIPLADTFLKADSPSRTEPFYPLRAFVCKEFFPVQLETFEGPEARGINAPCQNIDWPASKSMKSLGYLICTSVFTLRHRKKG